MKKKAVFFRERIFVHSVSQVYKSKVTMTSICVLFQVSSFSEILSIEGGVPVNILFILVFLSFFLFPRQNANDNGNCGNRAGSFSSSLSESHYHRTAKRDRTSSCVCTRIPQSR